MSKKFNFGRKIAGKGYYIALILCAVAIGISGYLYFQAVNQPEEPQLGGSDIVSPGGDVQAGITLPGDATTPSTGPAKQPRPIGRPVSGSIDKDYAMDCLSYNETTRDWRVHNGIDFAAEAGTQVNAAAPGTVTKVFKDDSLGYTVVITHEGGYVTQYASLAEDIPVKVGDTVAMGDKIGIVANTALLETAQGDHLHFSVMLNNEPIDPEVFLEME